MKNILTLNGITKTYASVVANDNISLSFSKGEVHAILGENGAGKSTLMNILYGSVKSDSGFIEIKGKTAEITSPKDAIANGIGMVHQHFMLIDSMSVLENLVLSANTSDSGFMVNENLISSKVKEISEKYGLEIPLHSTVRDITVGQQQRVEIMKVLYKNCTILILDEPTTSLTPIETEQLMNTIRLFKEEGKTVIFISHKLKEIMAISDRVSVLRNGQVAGTVKTEDTSIEDLVYMMVGRNIPNLHSSTPAYGKNILSVHNLTVRNYRSIVTVNNVSLNIREGEIYGLAGVDGNGQNDIIKAIAGIIKAENGSILFNNIELKNCSPRKIIDLGIAHIPEDRQREGLVLEFNIEENYILDNLTAKEFKRNKHILSWTKIKEITEKNIEKYKIKAFSSKDKVASLSGGNQQKVIIARALEKNPKLLLAVNPTRGVDVGSVEFIHQAIINAKKKGCTILLFSADLDEILQLSDRIGVMFRGRLIKEFIRENFNADDIGKAMIGAM